MVEPACIYTSLAQVGQCRLCSKSADLRFGVCFDCCDHVEGEQLSPILHKLWDERNPSNVWYVQTDNPAHISNGH